MRQSPPQTVEEKCTSTKVSSNEVAANYDTHVFDVKNKCELSIRYDLNIPIDSASSLL
jgi:hypothetical protein